MEAPPKCFYKVNWDAAFSKSGGSIGFGIIVREHEGKFMATKRVKREGFSDSLLAESIGALHATLFVVELGMRKIVLEGDSLQALIKSIILKFELWNSAGMIISNVKQHLCTFDSWFVNHIRRTTNGAAHMLAKSSLELVEDKAE
ncbi:uncharacterized protein LOC122304691 [Carya illinoinensis]|uniref:uncharacterized protein LOC122304691 n=1 Tax=Carya illinoinensis TaxID=32201 RepID=UPI001C71A564|nr:uncharacterized protein LOC122304691 [Carya illinoinensis]